jgi:hypothetical protein
MRRVESAVALTDSIQGKTKMGRFHLVAAMDYWSVSKGR